MGRFALCLAMIALLLAGTPRSAFAEASRAVKLETLYRQMDAPTFRPPRHKNDDIESAGFRALKQKGDKRLYGLWRVLYAYKSNQIQPRLNDWIDRVRRTARAENDVELLDLADLLDMAYRHETGGFRLFSDADWSRFLERSGPDIALMAGIERMRTLGQRGTWAEASRYAASLMIRMENHGDIAKPLLAETHEVHSYTLAYLGDKEGALDHISQAIRLDERDAFYMRRVERLYDIAHTADQAGEVRAAEHFASIHGRMVRAADDPELITWDRYLCARIAGSRHAPAKVLACLAGSAALLDKPTDHLAGLMLRRRALARAQLGDAAGAKADLASLDAIPEDMFEPNPHARLLVTAYIAQAEGRRDEAFRLLDRWRIEDGKLAAAVQARSASQIASALEVELQSKRSESRRLAAEVGLNRSLARASLLIALLLAALATCGTAWGLHLRKTSMRLREARGRADAANEAKSAFLAVISHELRTPLNGMLGMAQALRGPGLDPCQREQIDLMIDSGDTLLSLLNDFLDLSKIEAGKLEIAPTTGDLVDACVRVVNGYQSAAIDKGVALTFTVTGDPPAALVFDAVRVRQCLTNLVSNALKFTRTGEIDVTLCCAPDPISGRIGARLTVTDTGIGMSAATLSKLFGAFTQADASITRTFGGTGLGLNITRRLAELMDGEITVASQEGVGSTFILSLLVDAATVETIPVERPVGESSNPVNAERPSSLQGRRVLVVDDHPVNRRVIGLFLQPFDCELVEAANGREALDALEHSSFDLVLMDVNMPVMDGLEATRRLRRDPRWARLPVIALTADVMRAQIQTCVEAGMDAHVAKPIDLREMLSTMVRVLAKPAGRCRSRI